MKINNWHDIPWKQVYQTIYKAQEQCVMAYKKGEISLVYKYQRNIVCSLAGRALAIRRITSSQGSSTPGTDNQIWDSPKKRLEALLELKEAVHLPKKYVASPVKRVYIPKPNSCEKRPLGIPTMIDRAVQAVYHLAVDPIVECQSDANSYGFRPYRSAQDAVTRIRTLLDKRSSPEWVLDADIAKCFDTISHDFLLEHTPMCDKDVLRQMLTSGAVDGGAKFETTMGTPQGGVISPLLCNVALNGLEKAAIQVVPLFTEGKRSKVHLTRYADDFVCTATNKEILEEKIKPAISLFLEERGLLFKWSKTGIVNIQQGFDFLGYTFQRKPRRLRLNKSSKQEDVLIVRPKKDNIIQLKQEIRRIITPNRPIGSIIRDLNPVLRGWSEYYRISYHSLPIFWSLGHHVWTKMWRWGRKRHSRRTAQWIYEKYCRKTNIEKSQDSSSKVDAITRTSRKWSFGDQTKTLFDIGTVTNYRTLPIKLGLNAYIEKDRNYYEARKRTRIEAKFRAAVYLKFNHSCPYCGESLHNGEAVELHHVVPVKAGGQWKLDNIQPLHRICHQSVTHKSK